MQDIRGLTGHVPDFISDEDLNQAIGIFKKFDATPAGGGIGTCHGLDPVHHGYPWFKRRFLPELARVFGTRVNLVFAMYLDLTQPFAVHSDIRPTVGQPYASCLIPCSVDHDPNQVHLASTNVFCELDSGTGYGPPPENVTLQQTWRWQRGDLIWWDTRLFHNSGAFEGFSSKQAIVIHTYV